MSTNTPAARLPHCTPGSHVQLPDGITATVLAQRGTTVWLALDGESAWRTVRGDYLTIL